MAMYYVNKNAQPNGDHEVHENGCDWMPRVENRIFLGNYTSCEDAVDAAKGHYDQVNGCKHCSPRCHTS